MTVDFSEKRCILVQCLFVSHSPRRYVLVSVSASVLYRRSRSWNVDCSCTKGKTRANDLSRNSFFDWKNKCVFYFFCVTGNPGLFTVFSRLPVTEDEGPEKGKDACCLLSRPPLTTPTVASSTIITPTTTKRRTGSHTTCDEGRPCQRWYAPYSPSLLTHLAGLLYHDSHPALHSIEREISVICVVSSNARSQRVPPRMLFNQCRPSRSRGTTTTAGTSINSHPVMSSSQEPRPPTPIFS